MKQTAFRSNVQRATLFVSLLFCSLFLVSCGSRKPVSIPVQFYVEVNYPTEENQDYTAKQLLSKLSAQPFATGAEITSVDLVRVDAGLCLLFQLDSKGGFRLYNITAQNLGKRIITEINGQPAGVRFIDEVIPNGRLFTFVEIPDSELPALVVSLQEALYKKKKR